MATTSIDPELRSELAAIAAGQGCELLDVAFHRGHLQLILDRPEGGVTLDDCQQVSKQVSPLLDVYDFGRGKYTLEVSSPGLDRKLYGPSDYQRFSGQLARVTFLEGDERSKRTVVGRLERFDENAPGGGVLHVQETESDCRHQIPADDVQLARLEIEL